MKRKQSTLDDLYRPQKKIDDMFHPVASTQPTAYTPEPHTFMSMQRVLRREQWATAPHWISNQNSAVLMQQPPIVMQMFHRSMNAQRPRYSSHLQQQLQRDMFQHLYVHSETDVSQYDIRQYYDAVSSVNSDPSEEWYCTGSNSGTVRVFRLKEWQRDNCVSNRTSNSGIRTTIRNEASHGIISNSNFCMGGHSNILVSFSNRSYMLLYDLERIPEVELSRPNLSTDELKDCYTLIPASSDIFDFAFLDQKRRDVVVCGLRSGNLQVIDLRQKNKQNSTNKSEARCTADSVEPAAQSMQALHNPRSGVGVIGSRSKKKKKFISMPAKQIESRQKISVPLARNTSTVCPDGSINCLQIDRDLVISGTTKGNLKVHDVRFLRSSENTVNTIDLHRSIRTFEGQMKDNVHLLRDNNRFTNFQKRMEQALAQNRPSSTDSDPLLEEIDDFGQFNSINHGRNNSNHFSRGSLSQQENLLVDCVSISPNYGYAAFVMGNGKRVGHVNLHTGAIRKLYTTDVRNDTNNTNSVRNIKGCFVQTPGCNTSFYCVPSLNLSDDFVTILDWSIHSTPELFDDTNIALLCGVKSTADRESRTMKIATNCGRKHFIRPSSITSHSLSNDIICGTMTNSVMCLKSSMVDLQ